MTGGLSGVNESPTLTTLIKNPSHQHKKLKTKAGVIKFGIDVHTSTAM